MLFGLVPVVSRKACGVKVISRADHSSAVTEQGAAAMEARTAHFKSRKSVFSTGVTLKNAPQMVKALHGLQIMYGLPETMDGCSALCWTGRGAIFCSNEVI